MLNGAMLALALAGVAAATSPDFDPASGYRIAHYRSVVPAPPEGVLRLDASDVATADAILIDVTPADGARRDPATGHWSVPEPHEGIAGSHWFPEAGRGPIDPAIERWFLTSVTRIVAARPNVPLVVYCLSDCWMSWNAALRLRRAGFTQVNWFADGLDGWRDLRRPLVPLRPDGD